LRLRRSGDGKRDQQRCYQRGYEFGMETRRIKREARMQARVSWLKPKQISRIVGGFVLDKGSFGV
jgi:hypothetical protein